MGFEPNSLEYDILELCRQGKKLHAIKLYKDSMNVSLKESKDYVEQLAIANGIEEPRGKGACFIATACYGDYNSFEVLLLRHYRDEKLLPTAGGRILVNMYYAISPKMAKFLENNAWLKAFVRRQVLSKIIGRLQSKAFSKYS